MAKGFLKKRELTIEEQQIQSMHRKKNWPAILKPYILLLPTFVCLAIFTFYPLANMVWLSFRNYNLLSKNDFIGLQNYRQLFFVNKDFGAALKNTVIYSVAHVSLVLVLSVLLALWLNGDRKVNSVAKRVIFFPHIVAGVSISMIFAWLMNSRNGLFNQILTALHMPTLEWLDSSKTALGSVVGISTWKALGYNTLIVLAAMGAISPEINEAATLDNTPGWRRLLCITVPMISPQVFYMLVNMTIGSFKVFDLVRLLTNGGPGSSTEVLVLYIYKYAFQYNRQVGYACAAGVILMLILAALTAVYFTKLEKKVHYQ